MADSILTPTVIAQEGLMQLENELVMGKNVHTDYRREFVKIGSAVTFRKPVQFTATSGATINVQDVTEASDTISISNHYHVAWDFTVTDLTLTIEEYSKRYILPGMIQLADTIDGTVASLYTGIWNRAGTPGTTPATFAALGDTATRMDEVAVPDDGNRKLMLSPAARWGMADALKGIYDNSMPKDMVRKGMLGQLANFQIYGTQKVPMHTTGTNCDDAAMLVTTAVSDTYSTSTFTSSVSIDGLTSATGTFTAGDQFTIDNVYSVNPVSKVSTGRLQVFTVTAAVAGVGNSVTCTVAPRIIASGPYQTVSAGAADNAAVTGVGAASTTYPQNLAFHKNAMALVMVPLQVPDSCAFKARVSHNGYGLTLTKDFDITNYREIARIDALWGTKLLDNRLACRLWG